MDRDVDRDVVAAAIVLFETPRERGHADALSLRARVAKHGDPLAALLAASPDEAVRRRWDDRQVRAEAREGAARLSACGGRLILPSEPDFPDRLAALDWGPPWLFVRGTGPLPRRAAAIVGTRRATPSAREFARDLARGVARAGVTVASGLARGIDAAAHEGALLVTAGIECATVAVLGTGVDVCYPAAHRRLFAEILERGLVVSELPPGARPLAHHFPMRNRILAALGQAVVVVQAPEKSGALLTAAHAAEAGVDVLAVPGDPLLPENAGSNRLLASGARVTLGVEDVLSAVAGHEVEVAAPERSPEMFLGCDVLASPVSVAAGDRDLLAALDLVPREVDRVAQATGQDISQVLSGLMRLELAGLVESVAGGRVRWTPRAARRARSNP